MNLAKTPVATSPTPTVLGHDDVRWNRRNASGGVLIPTQVQALEMRPLLEFVTVDDDAGVYWVIHRRMENGRYRWSARLRVDGDRSSNRQQLLDEWRTSKRPPGPPRPPGFPADHRPVA